MCSILCVKLREVGSESTFPESYPKVNILGFSPIILATLLGFLVRELPVSVGR